MPDVVYHGPTNNMGSVADPYVDAKSMGIFEETPKHQFQDVNAENIVR
jgi:ethanolamine-phosphate cytidylyltransferase